MRALGGREKCLDNVLWEAVGQLIVSLGPFLFLGRWSLTLHFVRGDCINIVGS